MNKGLYIRICSLAVTWCTVLYLQTWLIQLAYQSVTDVLAILAVSSGYLEMWKREPGVGTETFSLTLRIAAFGSRPDLRPSS